MECRRFDFIHPSVKGRDPVTYGGQEVGAKTSKVVTTVQLGRRPLAKPFLSEIFLFV